MQAQAEGLDRFRLLRLDEGEEGYRLRRGL
jgi:hypothetical protein